MITPRGRGDAPIEAPATEAGRTLLETLTAYRFLFDDQLIDWTDDILSIEAAARDEGRREAVRRLIAANEGLELNGADEAMEWAGLNASESPLLPGQVRVRGWDRFWGRLEQGFTASEQADHEGHRILVNGHGNRWCHDCEAWVYYNPAGDASESPPTDPSLGRTCRWHPNGCPSGRGYFAGSQLPDASESGQPPEASDE